MTYINYECQNTVISFALVLKIIISQIYNCVANKNQSINNNKCNKQIISKVVLDQLNCCIRMQLAVYNTINARKKVHDAIRKTNIIL